MRANLAPGGQGNAVAGVPVVLRPSPFKLERRGHTARAGQTIAEILADIPDLLPEVWTHGVVMVGDWEIPRDRWRVVKPRPGRHMMHVGIRPAGGKSSGGGGKNIFSAILSIALIVAVTAISGGILGPGGALSISSTLFGAGSTSAALLAAGVSVVGALAINAMAPTPSSESAASADDSSAARLGSADFGGNQIGLFDPIPFVAGRHRVAPPHLVAPWTESINDDQYINAIVGLNGAHDFEDIRINGAPIDNFADVQYEVRNVVTDDSDLTVITKQVFETQVGAELTPHKVQDGATSLLQDSNLPTLSYPQWVAARSKAVGDEIWLNFLWTGLINTETSGGTNDGGMPIRIRIRKVGDVSWINLPEFHVQRERLEPFRGMIKLRFEAVPGSITRVDQVTTYPPWKYALRIGAAFDDLGFETDSYFTAVVGNHATKVSTDNGVAIVWLDPVTFEPGAYDIQVMRGYGYKASDFSPTFYSYGGGLPYFFSHTAGTSPPSIRREQAKVASKVNFASVSSVWEEYPLGEKGLSLIAVRAKNVSISSLTTIATGYANTWDGVDWDTFEPTRNPAAWWRYLALGGQSVRAPLIEAQLDDDSLTDWFDWCETTNRECNAYISGKQSLAEILRVVAGTGRAAGRISDKVGVVVERDRSAESTIAMFSQRNSRNLAVRRAFPRIPDGMRIQFNDEANDWQPTELFVYRRDVGAATDIESIKYVGITSESEARSRAALDFRQMLLRPALYSLETDIQNLYVQKGSLVTLAHDTIRRHNDSARIASASLSGGNLTGLTLETALRLDLVGDAAAAVFDGVNDYITRGAGLTGAADSKQFTFSCWLKVDPAGTGTRRIVTDDQSTGTRIAILPGGELQVIAANAAGALILNTSTPDPIPVGQWVHAVGSFDLSSTALRHLYIDDVSSFDVFTYTNDTIDFTRSNWAVGGTIAGANLFRGELAELWFAPGVYIDLSIEANRRKFLSLNGRPVTLGATGNIPTGTAPLLYLSAADGNFADNEGTGGALTLTGALGASSIFYSDGGFPAGVVMQLKDGSTLTLEVDEETETDTVTFSTPEPLPAYLTDQGAWTTATAYAVDDVVSHGGAAYSAIAAHTSGASTEPNVGAAWFDAWEPLLFDALVASGPFSIVNKRMIVQAVKAQSNMIAALTLVDEAEVVVVRAPGEAPSIIRSPTGDRIIAPY